MATRTEARVAGHKGRQICISGAAHKCLAWVDDKLVFGADRRFQSIAKARRAAVDYIERHTKAGV